MQSLSQRIKPARAYPPLPRFSIVLEAIQLSLHPELPDLMSLWVIEFLDFGVPEFPITSLMAMQLSGLGKLFTGLLFCYEPGRL